MNQHRSDALLAWYFVVIWGSGFIATKIGIQYAAPFTFLSLRFAFGILCLMPLVLWLKPAWPKTKREWLHIIIAGLLMHAIHLSGSHYAQYLGMSAGIAAVILALQPLATALIARGSGDRVTRLQWFGIALGFAGVALIVWHKIDVRAVTMGSLIAVVTGLGALTVGTLYQRKYCPTVDLHASALIQFVVSLVAILPLSLVFEGARVQWSWPLLGAIAFLVIGASILAVNALHTLMRHGEATRVTSMMYLPPIFAVAMEYFVFSVVPTAISLIGIAITSVGVAMAMHRARAVGALR
ncbi:MAG: DMT family transporter [Burkholderiales bacterium]|nr:DMT family transporter [Burkholderiales bacterium]